jgi:ribosomal protein S6--L-glutamate ligase
MSAQSRIGVLVEARYLTQSQPVGLINLLKSRQQHLTMMDPQQTFYTMGDDRWLNGLDLIVARGRSWALLCLLAWAERRGVTTINSKASIAAVHNKAEMSVALAAGKLPTPKTFFGSIAQLASHITADCYPLILKPIFGDNCRGLLVVHSAEELSNTDWPEPVVLAQSYFPTDGYDLKLYGIGEDVWAVRKPSPFNAPPDAKGGSELVPLTDEWRNLGRACGKLFGLELFGVDCIQTRAGTFVIEVNDYPNFTAVPDADERLADYVMRRAAK